MDTVHKIDTNINYFCPKRMVYIGDYSNAVNTLVADSAAAPAATGILHESVQ